MPVKDIFGVFDFTMCFDGKPIIFLINIILKYPAHANQVTISFFAIR
jgi:hypothetical protein